MVTSEKDKTIGSETMDVNEINYANCLCKKRNSVKGLKRSCGSETFPTIVMSMQLKLLRLKRKGLIRSNNVRS